ncbi:MAG: hypothetical protein ACHP9Y_04795 [Gammaproteobacteria bacterium]
MNTLSIYDRVILIVKDVAQEYQKTPIVIEKNHKIVDDLGFSSLEVAVLTARLEIEFECEPFTSGEVPITDVRTVGQVYQVYENIINGKPAIEGLFAPNIPSQVIRRRKRK